MFNIANILLYFNFIILFLNFCESKPPTPTFHSDCEFYNRTNFRVSNRCERDDDIIVEKKTFNGEHYWCIALNNEDNRHKDSLLELKIDGDYQIWTVR